MHNLILLLFLLAGGLTLSGIVARHPPSVASTSGPSGRATGLRPSNRIVMPDRAVPWMS